MPGLSVDGTRPAMVRPRRTYDRHTAAIGLIEVAGAAPWTVAAKRIMDEFGQLAFLRPFMLGSSTGTLVVAGPVEEVNLATDPKWLMRPDIIGKFEKRKPLVGAAAFQHPSSALWQVMQDLAPIPQPSVGLIGQTLGFFETLRVNPLLRGSEIIGKDGKVSFLGSINFGSKQVTVFFYGTRAQVEHAKFLAKEKIRAEFKDEKTTGGYHGSWYEDLGPEHFDLQHLLFPLITNTRSFAADPEGDHSYVAIETRGLTAFFQALDGAAKRARVNVIAPVELGSGTETLLLHTPDESEANNAGDKTLILDSCGREEHFVSVQVFTHPMQIFGGLMAAIKPSEPRIPMERLKTMSIGLIDTVYRGLLYDALDLLKNYEGVELVGTRKIGSLQVFAAFTGPLAQVEKALEAIRKMAGDKLTKKESQGELFSLGIIRNPHEEALRLLPWQPATSYLVAPPEGMLLSEPYYQPDQPLAYVETLGLTLQLAIANAIHLNLGLAPVSRYAAGSGLEIMHYAGPEELVRRATDAAFLKIACVGIPNADKILLNAGYFLRPSDQLRQVIDHQQPVPAAAVSWLTEPGVALGAMTTSGMVAPLFVLDALKRFEVDLIGTQKSGGKLMTTFVRGQLAQVERTMRDINERMVKGSANGDYPLPQSLVVVGNPHPNLAFGILPISRRVGV